MRTKNVRYLIKSNGPQRVESTRRVTLYNDFAGCADAVLYGSMLAVTSAFQYPTDRSRLLGRAIVWAAPWDLVCVLVSLLRALSQKRQGNNHLSIRDMRSPSSDPCFQRCLKKSEKEKIPDLWNVMSCGLYG